LGCRAREINNNNNNNNNNTLKLVPGLTLGAIENKYKVWSPNIIKIIRWAAGWYRNDIHMEFWLENIKERDC
jgi:hypothetical protein